jgi:uncharacterized RDD family membrane protein YckC
MISGEGVAYDLPRADVGSRTIAALLDYLIQVVVLLILILIDVNAATTTDEAALAATVLTEWIVVFGIYPTLVEWLSTGRSIGKLAMGLRVVRDDGGPIGFRQALVRGLAALVLEKPGLIPPLSIAIGFLTMIFSPRAKRVGDMMAGTFVVNERAGTRRAMPVPTWQVAPYLQPWAQTADLSRVDDQLALSIRQFLVRAPEMRPEAQQSLGEQLRAQLESRIAPPPPAGTPTPWLLGAVLSERRRRAEAATQRWHGQPQPRPTPTPAPRSPANTPTDGFAPPS